MNRLAWLLLAVAAGCSQPKTSTLTYAGIAFDESKVPTAIAIRIHNESTEPAFLREALPNVTYKTVITDVGVEPPAEFDYVVGPMNKFGASLPEGEVYELPPGKTGELRYWFQWMLPPDAPPMVAVVRASFTLPDIRTPEERVETPEKIFVLQSQEGALEALFAKSDPGNAAKAAESLAAIEGDRSESVELLIRRMREIATSE